MSTLGELISAVCDDLMRNDITAQVSDSVVLAIRHYDKSRWWFQEHTATFTTTAGVSVYPLPSDYRQMDYVEVRLPGNNDQEVRARDFTMIRKMLEGPSTGNYPEVYAIRGNEIHLAYAPNTAYVVTEYYVRTLPELSEGASNSWTTGDGEELIRAHAAERTALRTLHDKDLAADFTPIKNDAKARMDEENLRRLTRGKVKPHY